MQHGCRARGAPAAKAYCAATPSSSAPASPASPSPMSWRRPATAVIVLDRGAIAGGMTSRTTAHLAPICDDGVSALIKLRGEDMARLFQDSQEAAVDRIEAIVESARHLRAISAGSMRFCFRRPAWTSRRREAAKTRNTTPSARSARRSKCAKGVPLEGLRGRAGAALSAIRPPSIRSNISRGLVAAIEDKGGQLFADSPVIEDRGARERRPRQHGCAAA